ncbi:hypothetical protein [Liquorilactobacillus ghanensis]|uniref:hypothetical protein n=1 Tax=Liquorilactobacillus ghanensis TaxID=399370 RepID=UPI0039E92084
MKKLGKIIAADSSLTLVEDLFWVKQSFMFTSVNTNCYNKISKLLINSQRNASRSGGKLNEAQ